jgi:hypothetical protein
MTNLLLSAAVWWLSYYLALRSIGRLTLAILPLMLINFISMGSLIYNFIMLWQ